MRSWFIAGFAVVSFAGASALASAGCGDTVEPSPSAAADAGSSGSSGSSGSTGADSGSSGNVACNELVQEGASVDIKGAKPPIPEATGGTAVDGKYTLTSVKAFSNLLPEGETVRAFGAYTLVISGGGKSFEQIVTNENSEITKAKGDLVVDGVNFTATPTCEQPMGEAGVTVLQGTFSAEATTLKMYVVREFGIPAELLFEKK